MLVAMVDFEITRFVITLVWNKILKQNFCQHNQDVIHIHYHCISSPKIHMYGFQQHYKAGDLPSELSL